MESKRGILSLRPVCAAGCPAGAGIANSPNNSIRPGVLNRVKRRPRAKGLSTIRRREYVSEEIRCLNVWITSQTARTADAPATRAACESASTTIGSQN
jgi:hypothetical protein